MLDTIKHRKIKPKFFLTSTCFSEISSDNVWKLKRRQNAKTLKTHWTRCQWPRSFCFQSWSVRSCCVMWQSSPVEIKSLLRGVSRTAALYLIMDSNHNSVCLLTMLVPLCFNIIFFGVCFFVVVVILVNYYFQVFVNLRVISHVALKTQNELL